MVQFTHQGQVFGVGTDRLGGHEKVKERVYGGCRQVEAQHT